MTFDQIRNTAIKYYWDTESELRINRVQFIVRWILAIIVLYIASFIVSFVITIPFVGAQPKNGFELAAVLFTGFNQSNAFYYFGEILSTIVSICFLAFSARISYVIYLKRYHDFDNYGKSPRFLIPTMFWINLLFIVSNLLIMLIGVTRVTSFAIPLHLVDTFAFITKVGSSVVVGTIICIFFMWIIAIFTAGSKGANTYGEPNNGPIL